MIEEENKKIVNNLLIQCNIKVLFLLSLYTLTIFATYTFIDYFNVVNNTLFGVFRTKYLLQSLSSNLAKSEKRDLGDFGNVTVSISGITENDSRLLGEILSSNGYSSKEILINSVYSEKNGKTNDEILLKTYFGKGIVGDLSKFKNQTIQENFELILESLGTKEKDEQPFHYSIYISFEKCNQPKSKSSINIYSSKISLFCIEKDVSFSNLFIMMNDLFNIWFAKFLERKAKINGFHSLEISIYDLFDIGINDTNIFSIDSTQSQLFEKFVSQIEYLMDVKIIHHNKYISENSLDSKNLTQTYQRLTHHFNDNNYRYHDENTLTLMFVRYFTNLEGDNGCNHFTAENDFLFTHCNIKNKQNPNNSHYAWNNFTRKLLLPDNYSLNFKSKLDKVVIKSHINKRNLHHLLTEWQLSALKLVHSKVLLDNTFANSNKLISSLALYNIYKFPKHVILALDYLRTIFIDIYKIPIDYFPVLLQNTNYLLFNMDIHNKKTYNSDLSMAIYLPTGLPILMVIIITVFRVSKHLKMVF
ncbi:hypothetical protein HWI79_560 [Cryptosporidium felis]|nr:hypothetical protein HWI79_560 [Cryptosporidium felis]